MGRKDVLRWQAPYLVLRACRVLLFLALLAAPSALANDLVQFARGSLIIPEQASFQSGCGAVSAYGLVWKLLQSNRPGGYNASHPVTVYIVINGNKASPNRCVPTNLNTPPQPTTGAWNDLAWNDGCDASISNTTMQPVVPVPYGQPWPASGVFPVAPVPMSTPPTYAQYNSNGTLMGAVPAAVPSYSAVPLGGSSSSGFTTIQYMGGPFVISAQDAPNVIGFLNASASDPTVNQFTTPCTCGAYTTNSFSCHYVQMHQATSSFTAFVGRRMQQLPPKIAVMDTSYADGNTSVSSVLVPYLANAGLNFPGAAGCPAGTFNTSCTAPPGQIFDRFDALSDFISTASYPHGLINATDVNNRLIYRVLWLPHWQGNPAETYPQYVPNGDGAKTQLQNALNNIAYFTDQSHTGLMAACASIATLEGSSTCSSSNSTGNGGTCTTSQVASGSVISGYSQPTASTSFLFTKGTVINGLSTVTESSGLTVSDNFWEGRSCGDPNYNGTDPCSVWPNAADPIAQVGDFHFMSQNGAVHDYRPLFSTGSTYQPGVEPLVTSWLGYSSGAFPDAGTPASDDGWDLVDVGFKNNDVMKATVVYIGGHEFHQQVAGQRIILNTLLNLGAVPSGPERSLAAPVTYSDPNGTKPAGTQSLLFTSTYQAITDYPPGVDTWVPAHPSLWTFPYYVGTLRAHAILGPGALSSGENALTASTLWDADGNMPAPGARNVFTYLAGKATTMPTLPGGAAAPRGVLQSNWVPEAISGLVLQPGAPCVDVLSLGKAGSAAGGYYFGLVPGSDGICDLQEALQYTSLNAGTDYGASEAAANQAALAADLPMVGALLQRVRGYCYATTTGQDGSGTPILQPTVAQCNNLLADNLAHMGGLVHSSPLIVQPSPHVVDQGAARPTVAYVGGYDGQLHAIYVSGGSGYQGPLGVSFQTPYNPSPYNGSAALSKFPTDYAAAFAAGNVPSSGTELWSFLPASQLPFLKSNSARVDSSPVAQDVFVDLMGTGVREWHTIVVASTGAGGGEIFAFDVTNPLKPSLLWDLQGTLIQTGGYPYYPVNFLANDDTGGLQSLKNVEPFVPTGVAGGRTSTGLYNYRDMGASSALAIAQFRSGMAPVYAVFVSTNTYSASNASGMEVFAIDAATGQKLWQWEQPYQTGPNAVDNGVPNSVSVFSTVDGVARVYAGDMEGRLWELNALTGLSVNGYGSALGCPSAGLLQCKLAALDASSASSFQPLTTNVAVARAPAQPVSGSVFASSPLARLLIVGTAGADWVQASAPGRLHLLYMDLQRNPVQSVADVTTALASGVLAEPAPFPTSYTGPEHLYGNITVSGQYVFYETAKGQVGDIMQLGANVTGSTRYLDLGGLATGGVGADDSVALAGLPYANYGGVAVFQAPGASTLSVLGAQTAFISNASLSAAPAQANASLSVNGNNNEVLYKLVTWVEGFAP